MDEEYATSRHSVQYGQNRGHIDNRHFFIAGGWFFGFGGGTVESSQDYSNELVESFFGLLGIAMGSFLVLVTSWKVVDSSPGLVFDNEGLTDNTSAFSRGFIPWSDISGFEALRVGGPSNTRVLYVILNDPDKYMVAWGPLKRALFSLNRILGARSPAALTSGYLTIGFDELESLANRFLTESRAPNGNGPKTEPGYAGIPRG